MPSGCFSVFFTGTIIIVNLVLYFLFFPWFFPSAAYAYISDPSIRVVGIVDLASSIYISVWLFRLFLIHYFHDLKSFDVLARMNFMIGLLFCVANFSTSADFSQKVLFGSYFIVLSIFNYVPLSFKKSVRIWGGFVSVLSFIFLRVTEIVQF